MFDKRCKVTTSTPSISSAFSSVTYQLDSRLAARSRTDLLVKLWKARFVFSSWDLFLVFASPGNWVRNWYKAEHRAGLYNLKEKKRFRFVLQLFARIHSNTFYKFKLSANNYLLVQTMHWVAMKGRGTMKKKGRHPSRKQNLIKVEMRDVVLPGVLVSNLL